MSSIAENGSIQSLISSMKNTVCEPSDFKMRELANSLLPEPLLTENDNRFVLFPIKYQQVTYGICLSVLQPNVYYYCSSLMNKIPGLPSNFFISPYFISSNTCIPIDLNLMFILTGMGYV